jgi:hypothetical protein
MTKVNNRQKFHFRYLCMSSYFSIVVHWSERFRRRWVQLAKEDHDAHLESRIYIYTHPNSSQIYSSSSSSLNIFLSYKYIHIYIIFRWFLKSFQRWVQVSLQVFSPSIPFSLALFFMLFGFWVRFFSFSYECIIEFCIDRWSGAEGGVERGQMPPSTSKNLPCCSKKFPACPAW